MPKVVSRIVCYLWVAALSLLFFTSVQTSYRQSLPTEEFAYACDSFGYLRMAKQIRLAFANRVWPEFKLESTQTRELIGFMQQRNLPVSRWEEVVAPHAHHYFPRSGYVGVQYPPGTGLVLSMFPQGEAVYGLNRIVVLVFLVVGVGVLVIAAWKRAWASIGLAMLALSLGMIVLTRMGSLTFSINAVLVPILFTCLLTFLALRLRTARRENVALLTALVAGLCLGFATLIRLPSFLLMPGCLVLLWPDRLRIKSLPVAFVLGVTLIGVLPVLVNQQNVAGAWYLPTYADVDAALPTFESLKNNFRYFLGNGPAAVDNWALLYALFGFAGFLIFHTRNSSAASDNRFGLSWKRLTLASFLLWIIPICYFLTHAVTGVHYMISSVFATITVLGVGALSIESTSDIARPNPRRVLTWVALVLIFVPAFGMLIHIWPARTQLNGPLKAHTHQPILLPAELADDKAWIWADLLTGSLWYYDNKPAFKIQFTDDETRAAIFRFVFDRGERQYLLQDSEQMKKYMEEIEQLGGKLEMRGKVDGQPYFLIVWPDGGPAPMQARR